MRKHGPFFPRGIVFVGIDINLGFEESATEEMEGIVAEATRGHGGSSRQRGGDR